jgi:hypothetical protein
MDINLSSDDETMHLLVPDAPADKKVPAGDDIGGEGATSVEPIAPSLIRSGAPEKPKPSTANRVLAVPPSGRRG